MTTDAINARIAETEHLVELRLVRDDARDLARFVVATRGGPNIWGDEVERLEECIEELGGEDALQT